MITSDKRPVGLYIHIPFCVRKCLYCDFVSTASSHDQYRRYVAAAVEEMKFWREKMEGIEFSTVYLGGGTPSLIGAELIGRLIESARKYFAVNCNAEVTVEVNPGTISRDFWAKIQKVGVNRVSIGVQSFSDSLLAVLGRPHDSEAAIQAVGDAIEAGLVNVGVDLIYGIPGQAIRDWEESLRRAVEAQPAHISAYCLSYEEGTPFEKLLGNGEILPVAVEVESRMYYCALQFLQASGYRRYEISNFAQTGFECRHNLNYWACGDYLGIGAGAHSFYGGRRWENTSDIHRYLGEVYSGPAVMQEPLNERDRLREFLMVGLRKAEGVPVLDIEKGWNNEMSRIMDVARRLESDGFVGMQNGRLYITDRGLFVSNDVIAAFF